jgi:uncharacterized protein YgiM (DUF1202 family)
MRNELLTLHIKKNISTISAPIKISNLIYEVTEMSTFRFSSLILALTFFIFGTTALSQTKRRTTINKKPVQVKFAFQKGLYLGLAENTTSASGKTGEVEFNLIDASISNSEISVSLSFKKGLCGEGVFDGIIDDLGFSLTGTLTCGSRSMKMVTRCVYTGSDMLDCQYKLLPNQKGYFKVQKFRETTTVKTTTIYKKRYNTSKAFPQNDLSVDLAVVAVETLDLREKPNEYSTLIKTLETGDLLVLVDREKTNDWYNVIDVKSGKDGWVTASDVDVRFTQTIKPLTKLEESTSYSTSQPEIKIINDSNVTLYLNFGGAHYTISANDSISFTISPGNYKFFASSPGVLPDFGESYFRLGHIYTWRFYIVTR